MADKEKTEPQTFEEIHAEAIREKVQAGLTREQAIQVVRDQLAHDKKLKEQEEAAAKASKKSSPREP